MTDKPRVQLVETEATDEQGNLKTATLSKSGGRSPFFRRLSQLFGGQTDD